jgi:hypothetical protein
MDFLNGVGGDKCIKLCQGQHKLTLGLRPSFSRKPGKSQSKEIFSVLSTHKCPVKLTAISNVNSKQFELKSFHIDRNSTRPRDCYEEMDAGTRRTNIIIQAKKEVHSFGFCCNRVG